ncbi:MAG: hypothetical protein DA328_07405 [Nitrososphaeraceae archaeon]|nr:hypothetical protein [Nitrososphaeraceae archaeon]
MISVCQFNFRYFLLPSSIIFACISVLVSNGNHVQAHIFLDTPNIIVKDIEKYKIVLLPFPNNPIINETVNFNFNVQENKTDLNGIFSHITITNNKTKQLIFNSTYKFHEFSDFTIPFVFNESGTYVISLYTKISWDPTFSKNPMIANFDIKVSENTTDLENTVRIIMYASIIIISIVIVFIIKKSLIKKKSI